jgi:hypothetical protein
VTQVRGLLVGGHHHRPRLLRQPLEHRASAVPAIPSTAGAYRPAAGSGSVPFSQRNGGAGTSGTGDFNPAVT